MRKAGSQRVSETDTRNLVEFWKQIYDIDISPDEIPLLKIKMVNPENTFTYPPSMCFFAGGDSLSYSRLVFKDLSKIKNQAQDKNGRSSE